MSTKIRTLNFLPEIFKTPTNAQFLNATLDQLTSQPSSKKIEGYVGSKFGYGINAKDYYVPENTKVRKNYQLEPGVIFTKPNESVAQDFISYPGIIDSLNLEGSEVANNSRLFESQFYSWDSFTNLDKIINYNQYYWLPTGPESVTVTNGTTFDKADYIVYDYPNSYDIKSAASSVVESNPTLTLLRGGTYTFAVNQDTQFWIQGEPGVTGFSATQPNLQTRDVYGVINNGANIGFVTFNVPEKTAQDEYNFPGNNVIDLVSTTPLNDLSGMPSDSVSIDGISSLNGLTVMFYDTGVPDEVDPIYNTIVNQTFYTIQYVGSIVSFVPLGSIPINEKITSEFGNQFSQRNFYKATLGTIYLIPYISSVLDTLYYQDSSSSSKVGIINLIDSNQTSVLNVETEILGKTNFTSKNNIVFTNGLKVSFQGNIIPSKYATGQYYVEGVGDSINLIPTTDLVVSENYSGTVYTPWDILPWDIGAWEGSSNIPTIPDYITISRNSFDRNAWTRSNRWFHIDVINATATYNNNPNLITLYTNDNYKAKRPIIEFYGNLKLFNSGTEGKPPVDFIDTRATDAFSQVAGQTVYYPDVTAYSTNTATLNSVLLGTSTTITVPSENVFGKLAIGQYITNDTSTIPNNSQITQITGTTTLTITISWSSPKTFSTVTNTSFITTDTTVDNYSLFSGSTIIFANDTDEQVRNKIYTVSFSTITPSSTPIITLTEISNGTVYPNQQTVIVRGYNNQGKQFYYDGIEWIAGQTKTNINQSPLFDVLDKNGTSFGNEEIYLGTSFKGCTLFSYGLGIGVDDLILNFPIRYSSIDNVGDISFDVSLNSDTFSYVNGPNPIEQKVNTGYVYQYNTRVDFVRQLGWQTAISPSVQYQIFEFEYDALAPNTSFICDIAPVSASSTNWPVVQVYINNVLQTTNDYTVTTSNTSTVILLTNPIYENTVIQVLILSDQVSKTAYYNVPTNLNNNPFNTDITTANLGDIREQYQSIFYNNPNSSGNVFGPNNYRDLGNVVPYGNAIIQNSASLVLPGAFLRKTEHNLFNSLLFNSREYIKFKNLLVDVVNNTDYNQRFDPAYMLDDALSQITANKTENQPFFWSDMLPSKAASTVNTYKFLNSLDVSVYPLTRVYNFDTANYYGVLVYLIRTENNIKVTRQLIVNQDYTVSSVAPSLTITLDLLPNDEVVIKEYNQTYGSYVPNTPTKLGLYPSYAPEVILDSEYNTPTYFIRGHDGSYNKLYGEYDAVNNILFDFRDQVLLEFEKRVYNNLKLSDLLPINLYELIPGFFRTTDYSYDEWLTMYSVNFLNWIGQNRLNYKKQLYQSNNEFTYNYTDTGNVINKKPISQGYWRGLYQYFYDTTTPNITPWELLGFTEEPVWWTDEYGPYPYTSDNMILWNDLENGIIRQGPRENISNNQYLTSTNPYARPGLTQIIPVDSSGDLKSPLKSVVGAYNTNSFIRDWKVGDDSPVELSYRRSSTYPYDLIKLMALMKPSQFFNLAVDLDNYKFNEEFNQYLVNDRSHLNISNIEIYGNGTAKTSYINWIVDYEKQVGINATENITTLLDNLDVRLVYRLAGFSDKTLLKFYVEKGSPNSKNSSLLIPDESYSVLLYDNQAFDRIQYSGVVVQKNSDGYVIYGNSQNNAYFKTLKPKLNENYKNIQVEDINVRVNQSHYDTEQIIPYGYLFYNLQDLSQFLINYGAYLETQGMIFDQQENELTVDWYQMVAELLYWAQTGWENGSIVTLNPIAKYLKINKDGSIVQPLTLQQSNFVLNQNLYPIQIKDLNILRDQTLFSLQTLNEGDAISYGEFNVSNFEHGIVFDNVTLFSDIIYNLVTGLRQNRIFTRGVKSAEWNGSVTTGGFILNQDNILEWNKSVKYTKGSIVKYKNKYWTALQVIQPKETFAEQEKFWKKTEYDSIQKGLLPNASTRAYESTLYYDCNKANLEKDADLLSFSLIGYRPRDYMALADLTDITQVNVYKNLIKNKGTRNATDAFKGANLPQGGIDYDVYENWAILAGEFGGVLNSNFVEVKLNQNYLTGNPSTLELTNGIVNSEVQQQVPLYSIYNYARPVTDVNILSTVPDSYSTLYPTAGYVNFNDVKMSSYFYSDLPLATNINGSIVPVTDFYVRDYLWLAEYLGNWQVYTPVTLGEVIGVRNNLNNTITVIFDNPHNLTQYDPFAIVNFDTNINGYYIVSTVIDQYKVIVPYSLDPSITELTGRGIGLGLSSQKVQTPSEILNLPLLNSEFRQNTVWVDQGSDGNWAVFRKKINYQVDNVFEKQNSQTYGSAVATSDILGYLISDSGLGQAYRYTFNELTKTYNLVQTITSGTSFGKFISYSDDIFIISEPTVSPKVHIYKLEQTLLADDLVAYQTAIAAPMGVTNWGSATAISGDKKWVYISDIANNKVHVYRKSELTGLYVATTIIDANSLGLTSSGDNFSYSIATDYYGDTLIVSAPNQNYSPTIEDYGYTYIFDRSVQNLEVQYSSTTTQIFNLAWTHPTVTKTVTGTTSGYVTLNNVISISVNDPIMFTSTAGGLSGTNIIPDKVYFVENISGSQISLKESRTSSAITIDPVGSISGVTCNVQTTPLYVTVNSKPVTDNNYAVTSNSFYYTGPLNAGDIINVSGQKFTHVQTLYSNVTTQVGINFGTSVDTNVLASEIIIGAPYELNNQLSEGAVYRYTNSGGKYGTVIGTNTTNVTSVRPLLLNGYLVNIPIGNAINAASAINNAQLTNIIASADNGKLTISLKDINLAPVNEKLLLSSTDINTLSELGIQVFTNTQVIKCPHQQGRTQFGTIVKFNEYNSFVASAPVGTRYMSTTFDFTDNENQDDDTIFDNNATQFIDSSVNAGAAYMFDYVSVYDESLINSGKFIYAQNVNSDIDEYGSQPYYGNAIDFNNYKVILGSKTAQEPVITYNNASRIQDWSVHRKAENVVDINRVFNLQIFSAETNNTLINLDYIDPLQGKILGAARENIDYISNADPAKYNTSDISNNVIWGQENVGKIWFDTSNIRYINYHQNDVVYDSKYWGRLFPGSDVAIYTWVSSSVAPTAYAGPGIPFNLESYATKYIVNESGAIVPIYFYWVRNTNTIYNNSGKTLSDNIISSYIENPSNSGISYLAPLKSNTFALYNCNPYFNSTDSILHLGYSTGTNNDVSHTSYDLIRENYPDDFLPGLPDKTRGIIEPFSLYARMLDSLSGTDQSGAIVPDPYLPKSVQQGVLVRPRQSFFVNRLTALQNYIQYANELAKTLPLLEILNSSFLYKTGEFYNTTEYWDAVNWWAEGYNDSTKSSVQVEEYSYLSALTVPAGTIATVETNGAGLSETYIYSAGLWNRIGLRNGTIRIKDSIYDYGTNKIGFGDNFFDTVPFDEYPTEETRNIVRSLNEEIPNVLLRFRNSGLILLFNYIQSETIDSQNYLPWLNKTSLVDVAHTIRELKPIEQFQSDNQDFLSGYLNEVKPYHVVIKEFLFKYTGTDTFVGNITDFDLPSRFNTSYQTFISPELVYENADTNSQYLPNNDIWSDTEYAQWKSNYGLSLTGQDNVEITTLESYLDLNNNECLVNNSNGFPVNGVIKIDDEYIGYSSVDRNLNLLSGLTRGVNGSTITSHIPGANIYIDLPAILLLNSGRDYIDPPRVTAHIDTAIYPEPTKPAILSAVMSLDKVLRIDVVDPGQGYAVLPEIVIEPAVTIEFTSIDVDVLSNTIRLYAPLLLTGDVVQYKAGVNTQPIEGLKDNQWYYVNLLETTPTAVIGLYSNYSDCVNDRDRIKIYDAGSGTHYINEGARASAITASSPVRENNITLRFDRTTYDSDIIDWQSEKYYGAFYAGTYSNSENFSSSNIQLYETQPPINSILASNGGVPFEITDIVNDRALTFSTTVRTVLGTTTGSNIITLGNTVPTNNASGSTIGFYVGMPIKFVGNSGTSLIQIDETYYVNSIINDTQFTISTSTTGSPIYPLNTYTVGTGAPLTCYTGETVDTAVVTVNYPGIMNITATDSVTNMLSIPLNVSGTGGTNNFYIDLPLFFTGDVYGGIVQNQNYYVTTVVDEETFTISENKNPQTFTVVSVDGSTDEVVINGDTSLLSLNEPIIFNTMLISGAKSMQFGLLNSGQLYYVSAITGVTTFKISTTINGAVVNLTTQLPGPNTSALLTSQQNVVKLSNGTGSNMIVNVSLPVSPGQVDGQKLSFYETSGQYVNLTASNTSLLISQISAVVDTPSISAGILAFEDSGERTSNFYVNMPFTISNNLGLLNTSTTYYVKSIGIVQFVALSSSAGTNLFTCDTVEQLYPGMPIIFSGDAFGNIVIGVQYFVKTVDTVNNQITISDTKTAGVVGSTFVLSNGSGSMTAKGDEYITVSTSAGGSEIPTITSGSAVPVSYTTLNQTIIGSPIFSVSYILGGYRVLITNSGSYSGYATSNQLKITGNLLGGTTPKNDLLLTVDSITSNGGITNLICSGTVPGNVNDYYLKVVSPNKFTVYENQSMTIPVSGIGFPYSSIKSTQVTSVTGLTDEITVTDSSIFNLYDPVVFTGDVFGGIVLGETYYILTRPSSTAVTISTSPGDPLTIVDILSNMNGNMVMAKLGSVALLSEPFYFDQSIVRYNNNLWACIISNNDAEFVFGKWELLTSGDRRLNALDRILGYYRPDQSNAVAWNEYINMPGNITELVSGISYPYGTYAGNRFAPGQQYPLDTILENIDFEPPTANIQSVTYDGTDYINAINSSDYSGLILTSNNVNYELGKLSDSNINVTDILYAGNKYVVTTNNIVTPIYRSNDGNVWTTTGLSNAVTVPQCSLNSISYNNGVYVAVGSNIVSSNNTLSWTQRYSFVSYLNNILYDVKFASVSGFSGFVTVGKGQILVDQGGIGVTYDVNLLLTSANGSQWTLIQNFTDKGLYGVSSNSSQLVVVGEDGIIYVSTNSSNWSGLNETTVTSANSFTNVLNVNNTSGLTIGTQVRFTNAFNVFNTTTTYYVVNIISSTQLQLSTSNGGLPVTLNTGNPSTTTYMYVYPRTATLRDIGYFNNKFIAVGDSGLIRTSTNGITWNTIVSGTTKNLNGLTYNSTDNQWVVVGDDNTILISDDNGISWTTSILQLTENRVYDIQGADFEFGYGPEELVPGTVKDNLTMLVATRPGTNWSAVEYEHVGYGITSIEYTPTSGTQVTYSYLNVAQTPVQVAVYVVSGTTGVARKIYQVGSPGSGPYYTVNWMQSTITLSAPLSYLPVTDKLRIEVYEVGNGDQLVKANSYTDPIRTDEISGLKEIYVNCNYSGLIWNGSGIIKPYTYPIQVSATQTDSITDTVLCEDVSNLVLNSQVKFQGTVFGGIAEDFAYYIKSISYVTNRITLSTSATSGIAGPLFSLTNGSGLMYLVQQIGSGLVYSEPVVYHNGSKLQLGVYGLVLGSSDVNDSIKVNTTSTLVSGQTITFGNTITEMGPQITPLVPYTILSILDNNELILSDPSNPGNPLALPNWEGGADFVTKDYSFGYQPNGIQAKIVFANQYNQYTDYLVYSLFGETEPIQYDYTLPQTQLITANGTVGPYALTNYLGGANISNAIVEINGLRINPTVYTINFSLNQITFASSVTSGDSIAVTTYNSTDRQYFNTNTFTNKTVANIANIDNAITPYLGITNVTSTNSVGNIITCNSTTGFVVNATVIFKGTSFDPGISTGNQVYFVNTILSPTTFTIKNQYGAVITLTGGSGLMLAYVGGVPAARVTTGTVHNLSTNDVVRIDGTTGSVQLNNNIYYARVITDYVFDLYNTSYSNTIGATNNPVTEISSYISGGYVWKENSFILYNQLATNTTTGTNIITVPSTSGLVEGTPIYFTESGFNLGDAIMGGIVYGQKYYVKQVISTTQFTISEIRYGTAFALTTDSGSMTVSQWKQFNTDRLWVTINGYKVPSNLLKINDINNISILSTITTSDVVLITSMIPSATPNEEVYMLNVNTVNEPSVYRANSQTRTWLTKSLFNTEDIIYVHDVSRLTNTKTQTSVTPISINGIYSVGLDADKDLISEVTVYNTNSSRLGYISNTNYEVVVESLSPVLKIVDGSYIDAGDILIITTLEGSLIYINGEQIKFKNVNTTNNTLSGLQRGANNTGEQSVHDIYSEVFSLLSDNRLTNVQYSTTWNSNTYNAELGDPLQVSTTETAQFLNQDIN